jgi:glutamate dehydrogenase/leucine dehydrogenase
MTEPFEFADELGPEKVIEIYDPQTHLKGVLVIDNVAIGPAIGGVRMAADATVSECFRLARAMTLKNAAANLPHGGGKSIIIADPSLPAGDKERLIRSFAHAIADVRDYIPGPDMGTNETAMAWVRDVTGRAVGLPRAIGGIPLDEIGATGLGLAAALEAAQAFCDVRLDGARVAVQGFGSVGKHAARFLVERGARIVAVGDSGGARWHAAGFDVGDLIAFKQAGHSVADYGLGERISEAELINVDCDIWIPAARPDVLRRDNVDGMKARIVAQGANIPATSEAEQRLAERGVLVLPDFIANAGGVICASVEYHGGSQAQALATITEKISANTQEMLARAAHSRRLPRAEAIDLAVERVRAAMGFRRTG